MYKRQDVTGWPLQTLLRGKCIFRNGAFSTTKNNGEYILTISGEYKDEDALRIIAGEKLIFAPFRRDINFENTKNLKVDIGLGPSQDLADLGNLYITNKANVHFRDKPQIGGSTLFLLPKGEPIAVEQVSKSLYFGTIEILVSSGNLSLIHI